MAESPARTTGLWLLLPAPVRRLPADLAAVVVLVVAAVLVVTVPGLNATPLRVVFGLPLVLFLPGYALIAALFPEAGRTPHQDGGHESGGNDGGTGTDHDGHKPTTSEPGSGTRKDSHHTGDVHASDRVPLPGSQRGIDGIERVALSFGMSIAVVPLLGLMLNFTPWGITLGPIMVAVTGFTLGVTGIAAVRRQSLPEARRFRVPYRNWIDAGRSELFAPESRLDGVLNVLLVCSILLAVGTVGYAVVFPPQGESFTEFYLLTEEDNGDLVAAGYPTEFELGQTADLVVGVENHEGEPVEYTVVIQLQAVETEGNETTVTERVELDRIDTPRVADNETWQHSHAVEPTMAGEELRLQYLLYRGEPSENPTADDAYRDLHLWVDVRES